LFKQALIGAYEAVPFADKVKLLKNAFGLLTSTEEPIRKEFTSPIAGARS